MSNEDTREPLGTTPPSDRNFAAFSKLFPGVIREGVLDTAQLAGLLGVDVGAIKSGKEVFGLSWAGKKSSSQALQLPSYAALVPDFEKSINWDTAENVFIEGDNLEVLKLLKDTYNDKVKMIYIDPPYNTGNDFVYNDDFSDPKQRYLEITGQVDSDGNRLTANPETSGRKHSNWLNMMYPRLSLARNLLTQDGAIFVSIDDNEVHNLRAIMDGIFGPENFIAQLVWAAGRKNDARFISSSHEYVVVYARSLAHLVENDLRWRTKKEGLDLIYEAAAKISKKINGDFALGTKLLKEWFKNLPEGSGAKRNKQYCHLDEKGVFFPDNISWPGGGGPRYEVLHPLTRKPVKIPSRGWLFTQERMADLISKNGVHFGVDEDTVPTIKRYLSETEFEVPYSVFYNDGRGATKRLREFLGGAYFDFPKDEFVLQKLIEFATDKDSIVLDFFAGSGTTGHAIELQNIQDGGNRRFICVTLDEETPKDSEARKAGFEKVSQITESRLTKVAQIGDGARSRGLRVLRLGPSNYEPYFPDDSGLFSLKSTSKSQTYSHRSASAEVILKQGVELHQPWSGDEQIQSGSVLFLGDNVEGFEPNSLAPEVMVVVANEDAFEGKDDLKAKIHFDLKQMNKKLVTY